MIAVWDARNASGNLKYCMRVTSGPDIVSLCGFVYRSHKGKANLKSYRREIWSNRGPERRNCGPFEMPQNKKILIALGASKIPDSADSKVECKIVDMQTNKPLRAYKKGKQVNEDTGWISLMSVTAPTTSQSSTLGYTLVRS